MVPISVTGSIAVTGGTGFIGRRLLPALTDLSLPVRALTRGAQPIRSDHLTWIHGSLASDESLETLLEGATHLIHLAASVRGNTSKDFLRTNMHASERLFNLCSQMPAPPRVLFVSSLAAREPSLSHYAKSKHLAEQALEALASDLEWTIFRPPAVYGPGDTEVRALLQFALFGLLPVPSHAHHRVSLLHVDDLVAAMLAWLRANDASGQVLELSDSTTGGYDWQQLAKLLSGHYGRRVHVMRLPKSLLLLAGALNASIGHLVRRPVMLSVGKARELSHPDWTADPTEAMTRLDWRPLIEFPEGIALQTKERRFRTD